MIVFGSGVMFFIGKQKKKNESIKARQNSVLREFSGFWSLSVSRMLVRLGEHIHINDARHLPSCVARLFSFCFLNILLSGSLGTEIDSSFSKLGK